MQNKKILEVHIDKGMREGQVVTFYGDADQEVNKEPGDVKIVIVEKEHPIFTRKGKFEYYALIM